MIIRVCSGWHPAGSVQYGQRFLKSFDRHWPQRVELQVYTERPEPMPRGACRDLWAIPGAREVAQFMDQHPRYAGRNVQPDWKPKDRAAGYNFRFDAAKFWKQILIPQAAAIGLDDDDILIWLDGDVDTTAPVPVTRIVDMLINADVAFLGRSPKHSEIGFWAIRISQNARYFLETIANIYRSGEFVDLAEWHSAFVWDHVRRSFEAGDRLECHNLCPPGARGHVWPATELAAYTRHDKGSRKPRG